MKGEFQFCRKKRESVKISEQNGLFSTELQYSAEEMLNNNFRWSTKFGPYTGTPIWSNVMYFRLDSFHHTFRGILKTINNNIFVVIEVVMKTTSLLLSLE